MIHRSVHPIRAALLASSWAFLQVAAFGNDSPGEFRVWQDLGGRKIEAVFKGLDGDTVKLELEGGEVLPFPITKLSGADREWLAEAAAPTARDAGEFESKVKPFFEKNCIACHGPEKSKGKITLHTLDGDLAAGQELERWELILEMLENGEMPPEDEPQPSEADRQAVAKWIDTGLRDYVENAKREATAPTARRLTNFEYENTMRDLLGFELKLAKDLPEDPVKPYKFNNTANLMLMGPEQIDRYSGKRPPRHGQRDRGSRNNPKFTRPVRSGNRKGRISGLGLDEIGIWGNRRGSPATGMGLKSFPKTGEFRIRVKASAILPPGVSELPFRLVMGYNLNENQSTLRMEPIGSVALRNNPDHPEIFEFRGRIENHPPRPPRAVKGTDGDGVDDDHAAEPLRRRHAQR